MSPAAQSDFLQRMRRSAAMAVVIVGCAAALGGCVNGDCPVASLERQTVTLSPMELTVESSEATASAPVE